jgi:hypothetical protein
MTPLWQKTISRPPFCVCESYRYSVGQLAYECFFSMPLKVARALRRCQKSQRCHICTAVSMTPLFISQQCQWLRCAVCMPKRRKWQSSHSGVNDFTVHVTAVSMTPLWYAQRSQWLCSACYSRVNDSNLTCTVESDFWWAFFKIYGFTRCGRSPYDLFWSGSPPAFVI